MDDQIFKNLPPSKFHFRKIKKIPEIFVLFLFFNVHKENMFTTKMEDGREVFGKNSVS